MSFDLKTLSTHPLIKQIFRFGVVGGAAFVVDFGLLLFLTEAIHLNYLFSATISFIVSTIFNYILSIVWVFDKTPQQRGLQKMWQISLFMLLASCGLGINNLIMFITVEYIAMHYVIGKLVATVIVMIFNFITRKILLEGKAKSRGSMVEA